MSEFAADASPPPRQVESWTHVVGHVIARRPERRFCSCGWSHTGEDGDAAVSEHLHTAWPILLPRQKDETLADWRQRLMAELAEAVEESQKLWEHHRMGEPVKPGEPFPLIPDDWARADERVQVLERQLSEMRADLL